MRFLCVESALDLVRLLLRLDGGYIFVDLLQRAYKVVNFTLFLACDISVIPSVGFSASQSRRTEDREEACYD